MMSSAAALDDRTLAQTQTQPNVAAREKVGSAAREAKAARRFTRKQIVLTLVGLLGLGAGARW